MESSTVKKNGKQVREYVLIPLSKLEMMEKLVTHATKTSTEDADSSDDRERGSLSDPEVESKVIEESGETEQVQDGESSGDIQYDETRKIDDKTGEGGGVFKAIKDSKNDAEEARNVPPSEESSREDNPPEPLQPKPKKNSVQGRKRKREGISLEERRKRMEINWLSV